MIGNKENIDIADELFIHNDYFNNNVCLKVTCTSFLKFTHFKALKSEYTWRN